MAKHCFLLILVGAVLSSTTLAATPPSETLLPGTTKACLSIPDVDELADKWNQTQLGHLVNDPVMKPFIEDLKDQIKSKMSTTRIRLGLTMDDLRGIYGGELCLAAVQPEGDPLQHATVLLVDVTGHHEQAAAMLKKLATNLLKQGAKKRTEKLDGVDVTIFTLPKKRRDSPTVEPVYVILKDTFVAADHREVCLQIIRRLNGKPGETLAQEEAYAATMSRCGKEAGAMKPHIRWFVEPFGYAHVLRAAGGGRKKRGADLLKVLPNQGFDAVKGVGGHIFFATGDQEILHRTMVYAPPAHRNPDSPSEERYRLAARMLEFPNTENLQPQEFVGRDLGSYFTFNWKMIDAFEYAKTLVNELLGAREGDDLMEDIIRSLAEDKDGPQVDLRTDLIHHFAERASMITDCRRPITPESERLMFAIELTNPEAVRKTINKAFEADPDAEKREFEGHIIWEIITDDAPVYVEEIEIEGGGIFDPFGEEEAEEEEEELVEEEKIIPNSAITVANGHLIVASHVDFIVDMLKRPVGTDLLTDAADYQVIDDTLAKLGAKSTSFRFFTRTDEAYRPTYELIRQGKMPESKTILGKLLNRFLGPDEKGILREQQIDGSKMPEFDAVRRYLGPAGMYVQSEENGWFMAGCLQSKEVR